MIGRNRPADSKEIIGAWRSLVAHFAGGEVVGGSNPLAPTIQSEPVVMELRMRQESRNSSTPTSNIPSAISINHIVAMKPPFPVFNFR
jgi:hypothetical protein